MKKLNQISFVLILILMSSCAKVFYTPDAFSLAHNHKIIAIVPPSVSITPRKKDNVEAIKEQQKVESLNFQKEMFSWFLKRKMQNMLTTEIQDVETTNSLLSKAGFPENHAGPNELCAILGVDGIIVSNYSMSKPMSEGGAIALGLLLGVWGSTNEVNVSMSIHDGNTKKMIWNYTHTYSGSIGSSPSSLVNGLMRNASKKLPYMN